MELLRGRRETQSSGGEQRNREWENENPPITQNLAHGIFEVVIDLCSKLRRRLHEGEAENGSNGREGEIGGRNMFPSSTVSSMVAALVKERLDSS